MPISLGQLQGLITQAPQQHYQGGSGAGMRQGIALMQENKARQQEQALQEAKFAEAKKQQSIELEQKAFSQLQSAIMSGDSDAIELSAQQLQRLGYNIERPEGMQPRTPGGLTKEPGDGEIASTPTHGAVATGGQAPLPQATETPASDEEIDAFFKTKAGKSGARAIAPPIKKVAASPPPADDSYVTDAFNPEQQEQFESELISSGGALAPDEPAVRNPGAPGGMMPGVGKQKRSAWRVTAPDGRELANMDMEQIRSGRAQNVAQMFAPLMQGARDEIERTAALKAAEVAVAATSTMSTQEAIEKGLKLYQLELGPRKARYGWGGAAAGVGGGGAAGPSLSRQRFEHAVDEHTLKRYDNLLEATGKEYGINTETMKAESALRAVTAAASANNGTGDLAAMTKLLKAMGNTGAMSDRDLDRILGSSGLWPQFKGVLERAKSGRLPPELMKNVGSMAGALQSALTKQRQAAAVAARNRIQSDPGLGRLRNNDPELLGNMMDSADSYFEGGVADWAARSPGQPPMPGKAAPQADPDDESDVGGLF